MCQWVPVGNALNCPKIWVFAILGGEAEIFIFLYPQGISLCQNTHFDVLLVQIKRSTGLTMALSRGTKKWRRRPSWIFFYYYFWACCTFVGLTVQKLLAFSFSIGNALKVPKIGVFGDFMGENWNMYLSEPHKKHLLVPNHAFDVLLV